MPSLRLSAISFLNTAPLMWDFEKGGAGRDFEITYTVPSACAAALAANHADIGIIPAFTYAEIPGLSIIPDIPLIEQISAHIDACDYFLPIISSNSIRSTWVRREILLPMIDRLRARQASYRLSRGVQ